MTGDDLPVGTVFTTPSRTLTDAHFLFFSGLTGDNHPIHYDVEYARATRFGKPLAHGLLLASLTALGASSAMHRIAGFVFIEQGSRFLRPVVVGDTITPRLTVERVWEHGGRRFVRFATALTNQRGETVLEGFHVYRVVGSAAPPSGPSAPLPPAGSQGRAPAGGPGAPAGATPVPAPEASPPSVPAPPVAPGPSSAPTATTPGPVTTGSAATGPVEQTPREIVTGDRPWPARYTFAPALRVGSTVFLSGTTATGDDGAIVGPGDIVAQTRQIFRTFERLLNAAGGSCQDLVETTDYITTTEHYARTAAVRREFLRGARPASTGVVVAGLLREGALIEISGVAVLRP